MSRTQKAVAVAALVLLVVLAAVVVWHETRLRDLERRMEPLVVISDIRDVRPGGDDERLRASLAQDMLRVLSRAIDTFHVRERKCPESLGELTEPNPRTGEPCLESIPDDPWGNPYRYELVGLKAYRIRSGGPNGMTGDEDDVVWPP